MDGDRLFKEARRKALRYLTYRGRSAAELTAYLLKHGYGNEIAAGVLKEMTGLNYIDDSKLARDFIEQRLRRGYGPLRIRRELAARKFDRSLIDHLLPQLYSREEERRQAARWLQIKLAREGRPKNNGQIGRWVNFLRYRGFSEETIAISLKNYIEY